MRFARTPRLALALSLLALGTPLARAAPREAPAPLRLLSTIALEGVEGRIDHLALDASGRRLVVAALASDRVEVVDVAAGRVAGAIRGLAEPQGILFLSEPDRILVANGGDGSVRVFDGASYAETGRVDLGADADNLRFDPATGRVHAGFGDGGIAALEGVRKVATWPLAAHPEAFALEANGPRIYVNVPGAGHVAVLDRAKGAVVATWPLAEARANFPVALDETGHRLFVGCRSPSRLVVLDTRTGKTVASVGIGEDVDDVWIDAGRRRLLLSCGEGSIDVVTRSEDDRYERTARVPTARGARTSLLAPGADRLYVAVPHRGDQRAELRVYEVLP